VKRCFVSAICFLLAAPAFSAAAAAGDAPRELLMKRLAAEPPAALLFTPLTGLLLDYAESAVPPEKHAEIYAAENRSDLLRRLKVLTGKDLLDFGIDMFGYYEKKMPPDPGAAWVKVPAGPFRLYLRPGSPADADRDLIARDVVETAARVAAALDMAPAFEAACTLLADDENEKGAGPGLIPVYLHASRKGDGAEKIGKQSYGNASLGATIVERRGRTTFRIHVFYLNALSLAVVEHEIAHAVVLLASFDPKELKARELSGEADLRKAFMAGYRPVPSLLQEGLGDWAFYYHGFHAAWGLLPPPERMVSDLRSAGKALPLKDILAKSATFRALNYKAYSLEAASFLEHLFRTRAKDDIKRWLFAPGTDAAKTFESVFGVKVADAEAAWLGGLK
jgi:hypothetical protein